MLSPGFMLGLYRVGPSSGLDCGGSSVSFADRGLAGPRPRVLRHGLSGDVRSEGRCLLSLSAGLCMGGVVCAAGQPVSQVLCRHVRQAAELSRAWFWRYGRNVDVDNVQEGKH